MVLHKPLHVNSEAIEVRGDDDVRVGGRLGSVQHRQHFIHGPRPRPFVTLVVPAAASAKAGPQIYFDTSLSEAILLSRF